MQTTRGKIITQTRCALTKNSKNPRTRMGTSMAGKEICPQREQEKEMDGLYKIDLAGGRVEDVIPKEGGGGEHMGILDIEIRGRGVRESAEPFKTVHGGRRRDMMNCT